MAKFRFEFCDQYNYLHTKYVGAITDADIEQCVVQGNCLYPGVDSLVDFSDASLTNLGQKAVRLLVQLAQQYEPRHIKCAFVAPGNLEFGISRMYDAMVDGELPQNRAVFRSVEDAEKWLRSS